MTAADKLRELLASRPAMPNTEELVRWWRSSGELVREVLGQHFEMISDLVVADKQKRQHQADLDDARAKLRDEQGRRAELRIELDKLKAAHREFVESSKESVSG